MDFAFIYYRYRAVTAELITLHTESRVLLLTKLMITKYITLHKHKFLTFIFLNIHHTKNA